MDNDQLEKPNMVALGTGIVIGILWLAMAATSLWSAFVGLSLHRTDWWLAWLLVGLLLAAAGLSSIIATWHHQFRVKAGHD